MIENVQKTSHASISLTAGLDVPKSVVPFDLDDGRIVAVASELGNWLVLTKTQYEQLRLLQNGLTVGEIIGKCDEEGAKGFKKLIAQICARKFFSNQSVQFPCLSKSAFFYLTYACNLKCTHCYMYKERLSGEPLSLSEYEIIFDGLKEIDVENVTFSGGEPLLAKNFRDIVLAAHERGLKIAIFSNGTLWTKELIELAAKTITAVQISIDGTNAESCAMIRGDGVFDKALEAVRCLSAAGVEVTIATTPQASTSEEIRSNYVQFTKMVSELVESPVFFRLSTKVLDGRNCGASEEYFQQSIDLSEQVYDHNAAKIFAINHRPNSGLKSCGFGALNFTPDGLVYPCNRLSDCSVIASVREKTISEIFQICKSINAVTDVDHTKGCAQCALRYLCGGGCRLDNFKKLSTSDFDYSIRKECSLRNKKDLLKAMVDTTTFLYNF